MLGVSHLPKSLWSEETRQVTDATRLAVTVNSIVERVNILGYLSLSDRAGPVDGPLHSLFLEAAIERLCHCIVPVIVSTARARLQVFRLAEPPPDLAPVLRALVVANHGVAGSPVSDGYQYRVDHGLAADRRSR